MPTVPTASVTRPASRSGRSRRAAAAILGAVVLAASACGTAHHQAAPPKTTTTGMTSAKPGTTASPQTTTPTASSCSVRGAPFPTASTDTTAAALAKPRAAPRAAGSGPGATLPAAGPSTVISDVSYGPSHAENLDVHKPTTGAGPFPAILLVHGGGWEKGSKQELDATATALAGSGFVTVNLDYTLDTPGRPGYPNQLNELELAVTWLRANAARYGVDPTRIGALGDSAGGNLVALLATVPTGPCTSGDRVAAVVSWSGPMNLTNLDQGATECTVGVDCRINYTGIGQFAGCATAQQCPAQFVAASPESHVSPDSTPILMFNSTNEVIPADQTQTMSDALNKANVPNVVTLLPGNRHAVQYAAKALPGTIAWFQQWLG